MSGWWRPLLAAAPALLYLLGVARVRHRPGRSWPLRRTASFVAGAVLLGVAVSPPLDALAHADARAHMGQHLLLGMFAPLAVVLGSPFTVLLGAVPVAARRPIGAVLRSRVVHVLVHPVTAAVLNIGGLYLLYLTPLYELSLRHADVSALVQVHLVLSGCLFAWAIAGPDPAPRRPSVLVRACVLVLAAGAHAYLAKLLYAQPAHLPPRIAPTGPHHPGPEDASGGPGGPLGGGGELRQAAKLMYYGGDAAEIALAVALFTAWYRLPKRRTDARDRR